MAETPDDIPELIRWEEAMSTGFPKIDEQHQELIAEINKLYRIHRAGATEADIKAVLKFLGEFVKNHFRYEEGLMAEFKCPMQGANCTAHARFLVEYQQLVSNFSIEQDADQTASEIERMAARWLVSHICKVDASLRDVAKPGPVPAA